MTEGHAARVAAPAALALFLALGVLMGERPLQVALPVAAVSAALGVLAAWRVPSGWPLALTLLGCAAGVVVLGSVLSANLVWMGLCLTAAWLALTSPVPVVVAFGAVLQVVLIVEWSFNREEPGWAAWSIGTIFSLVACIFARRLRLTLHQLREAQAELAERSRAQERGRIAAEVHDVIGHALTVSLLHIGGAKLALDEDPEVAHRALAEAETLTRRSLEEVRTTVGLMRSDPAGAVVVPLPGAGQIRALVESYQSAGADIRLQVTGDLDSIGSARGLAAYRIVQESLTNATKHAPGQPATVSVEVIDGGARIVVSNSLAGPAPALGRLPEGSGLRGMQERAHGVGGSLTAGRAGSGWRVEAELPA